MWLISIVTVIMLLGWKESQNCAKVNVNFNISSFIQTNSDRNVVSAISSRSSNKPCSLRHSCNTSKSIHCAFKLSTGNHPAFNQPKELNVKLTSRYILLLRVNEFQSNRIDILTTVAILDFTQYLQVFPKITKYRSRTLIFWRCTSIVPTSPIIGTASSHRKKFRPKLIEDLSFIYVLPTEHFAVTSRTVRSRESFRTELFQVACWNVALCSMFVSNDPPASRIL